MARGARWLLPAVGVAVMLYLCSLIALTTVPPSAAAGDTRSQLATRPVYQPWATAITQPPLPGAAPLAAFDELPPVGPRLEKPHGPLRRGDTFGPMPGPVGQADEAEAWRAAIDRATSVAAPPTEVPPAAGGGDGASVPPPSLPPEPTATLPPPTQAPPATPVPTQAPPPTAEPKPTKPPKPTDEPKPTKAPKPTKPPKP